MTPPSPVDRRLCDLFTIHNKLDLMLLAFEGGHSDVKLGRTVRYTTDLLKKTHEEMKKLWNL
jgi:hypothetical protein